MANIDLKSWLTGYVLGLTGKPLPFGAPKEPMTFLYNGIKMPKLPKWDTETYPYAVILGQPNDDGSGFTVYPTYLVVSSVPLLSAQIGLYISALYATADGSAIGYLWDDSYITDSGDYVLVYEPGFEYYREETFAAGKGLKYNIPDTPIWANYDVYRHPSGGTLIIGASEPVPVYE